MKKKSLIVVVVLLVVVVCAYLGLKSLFSVWIQGHFAESQYAEMTSIFDRTMHFPKEYAEFPHYSEELLAVGEKNQKGFIRYKVTNVDFSVLDSLKDGSVPQQSLSERIVKTHKSIQPYTDGLIAFSKMPGYDMDAWYKEPGSEVPNFLSMQVAAKALLLRAYSSAGQNAWNDAFDEANAVFRLTQRNPASTIIAHLIAAAMQNMAADGILALTNRCNDPAVLKKALLEINRLDSKVNLNNLDMGMFLDVLVWLRQRKEDYPNIDLTPGKKGYDYYRQYMDVTFQNTDGVMTDHWPKQLPPFGLLKKLRNIGFTRQVDELMYNAFSASSANLINREQCAVAKYRLAQISLAAKIHQLETGTVADRISVFIPKLLPKNPSDPFYVEGGSADFNYDAKRNVFYSIGPDLQDDRNQVIFDPSNGIKSSGDISPLFAR